MEKFVPIPAPPKKKFKSNPATISVYLNSELREKFDAIREKNNLTVSQFASQCIAFAMTKMENE